MNATTTNPEEAAEVLVIRGSKERMLWMLVIGTCFLILSYWALVEQHMWLLGGACLVFALLGLAVTLLMMRPGSTFLQLDAAGFQVVAMNRRFRYGWGDVDGFFLSRVGGAEVVGIQFSSTYQKQRAARAVASSIASMEGAISNLYVLSMKDVCRVLNDWKLRANIFSAREAGTLRYKREGYSETRDALCWVMLSAPNFKYGLTLDEVFAGLEHGYQSVRPQLKDVERIAQWEASREKLQAAYALYSQGDDHQGARTLQEASELFTALRRKNGRKMSRQELGDTEHGANELDE